MSGEIWGSVYLLVDDLEASNGYRVSTLSGGSRD